MIHRVADPTSICSPTIIITLPPELAPRTVSVATARARAAAKHIRMPTGSLPSPCRRAPMMMATPISPRTSPATPRGRSRSPIRRNPRIATISGMVAAMIEASPASIHCIATQLRPRYSAFWHSPRITTARHCARVSARHVSPISSAMTTPATPDRANRSASANKGGTSVTIIRVEVKAEAHMIAKNTPMKIARMSMQEAPLQMMQKG